MPNLILRVSNISYGEFRTGHLLSNQPVLVGEALIDHWTCLKHWRLSDSRVASDEPTTHSSGERQLSNRSSYPDLEYLRARYGGYKVPVDEDGCRSEMTLLEVLDIWEGKKSPRTSNGAKIYVKDWHLALQLEMFGSGGTKDDLFYATPGIFVDDWMNNYYRKFTSDDFRFVVCHALLFLLICIPISQYMGPAGTFTRLHRDVCRFYIHRYFLFAYERTAD